MLSSGSCPPCSFSLVWPWLGSCGLSFVPVHIHARGVFLPGLLEVLGTHTLLSSISWAFWRFGDTHAPFCQQPNPCMSMHEAEDHLEVCMGTHTPRPSLGLPSGPYFVCVLRGLLSSSQPKALSGGSCPLGSSPLFGLLPFVSFVRRPSLARC